MSELQTQFGMIPLQCIQISPNQPRKTFDQIKLKELANSITEVGVLQPVLLRTIPDSDTMLELVAGERRYRASMLAGKIEIPGIVKQLTDQQVASIQLIENLQRDGVHPLEEAAGIQRLIDEFKMSVEAICKELGITRAYAYSRLKLLNLAPAARPAFVEGNLPASTALLIARMPVPALQEKVVAEILNNYGRPDPMSYRQAKDLIENRYTLDLSKAEFDTNDSKLVKGCMSCAACPKRTGNQPEIYSDISADVCTDPDCFEVKTKAQYERILVVAKKKKLPVFDDFDAYAASDLSANHCDIEQPIDSFDNLRPDVDGWRAIEQLVSADALPEPKAYFLNDEGKPKAIFEDGALQAALEKAGLAYTKAEIEKIAAEEASAEATGDKKTTSPRKSVYELRMERLTPIAKKETEYRQDLFAQIRSAGPLDLELLRCTAKIISREKYLSAHLTSERDYPADDEQLASHIDGLGMTEILLLLLDFCLSTTLDVETYGINEDTGIADDDEDFNDLLKLASTTIVDAMAVRVKHFLSPAKKEEVQPEEASTDLESAAPKGKAKGKKSKAMPAEPAAESKRDFDPAAAWPFPKGAS